MYGVDEEYLDITTENDTLYEGSYCIDAKQCYTLFIAEMGRYDYTLGKFFDDYPFDVELDGKKKEEGRTTHAQFF